MEKKKFNEFSQDLSQGSFEAEERVLTTEDAREVIVDFDENDDSWDYYDDLDPDW